MLKKKKYKITTRDSPLHVRSQRPLPDYDLDIVFESKGKTGKSAAYLEQADVEDWLLRQGRMTIKKRVSKTPSP
jgi:hypothetical protein